MSYGRMFTVEGGLYEQCHVAEGMTNYGWENDPKRLVFQFSRYKFVAKMLAGKRNVLEVGCADGCGARIVRQHVENLMGIDWDAQSIKEARELCSGRWPVAFRQVDFMAADLKQEGLLGAFDAVYCLDLFEHIADETRFLAKLRLCAPVCIIGTPSLESQRYASDISKAGHCNCKSGEDLRTALRWHWREVFMFGMNDEVVHTGFLPMSHYLLALCVA